MPMLLWAAPLLGLSLCFAAPALAADMMKPGLWETATTMEMPGMPFQPPPQTVRHCYTAQEVREEPVPKDDNCKVSDLKSAGNKVSWKVECKGEMAGKGEGQITYQGDSAYEGWTRMQAQGMNMTMKYKARRLGECK